MKCVVWYGKNNLKIEEKNNPKVDDDKVLVKIAYSGICGSDLHIINGLSDAKPPQVLGHECSGIIHEIGNRVKNIKKGDRVVIHPWGACGECYYCRSGQENFCENPFTLTKEWEGNAFSEFIVVKSKQVYILPREISLEEAALVEPIAVAIRSIDLANIKIGSSVAVLGGGPIGILNIQLAKLSGANLVVLSEPSKFRREVGKKVGADIVVNPLKEDIEDVVYKKTNNLGVDVCIDAVGIPQTIEKSVKLLKIRGTAVLVGWIENYIKVDMNSHAIYKRELTIKGSRWAPYTFYRAINMVKRLDLKTITTTFSGLDKIFEAIKALREKNVIKALIKI